MKRLKQWFGRLSFRKKMIVYGYLTVSPVLVIVCLFLSIYNYSQIKSEKFKDDMNDVDALSGAVAALQSEAEELSTYICINEQIREILTAKDLEEKSANARLWLDEAPMQIIQDMISLGGNVKTIAIYPENGIRPYLRCMDGSAYPLDIEDVRATSIYQEVLDSESYMVWKYIPKGHSEIYLSNYNDKVVICREMYDLTHKNRLGYIVIGVQWSAFYDLCSYVLKEEDEGIIILDKNGNILCEAGYIAEEVETYIQNDDFIKDRYREENVQYYAGNYMIICSRDSDNAGIVCKAVPRYNLKIQFLDFAYMPIVLLLGMLLALMPLLMIMSNVITRPLGELSNAINKFSTGDFDQQVYVTSDDEIGEVAKCFNRMVGDIKTLIEENYVITIRERESELAALQAQINPHFLYNTLDFLYWTAIEKDEEELGECILALSQLFRLVLNQGQSEVTVEHEAELVSRYLQIQKMRFSKRLNYEIEIDPEIKSTKIPKLILQPFVENAIVHGFENVTSACHLSITGRREGDYIRFEIADSGIGMRQDQIDALWQGDTDQYSKQRIGRYAIKNIRERLELRYHDDFRLEIQSSVGKGTTVILIVPCGEDNT